LVWRALELFARQGVVDAHRFAATLLPGSGWK
jgi:hypothetical protein